MNKNVERMLFIENIEKINRNNVKSTTTEYEIIADSAVIGELKYGPYILKTWEVETKREGEERKLLLKIREKPTSDSEISTNAAKTSALYHGGGIAEELVALSSLFLRRRLRVGPILRMGDLDILLKMKYGWLDKPLIAGGKRLEDIADWIDRVVTLDQKHHQKFILSTKLYHQSLLIIEDFPDIAYLNLVSAIEVLSGDYVLDSPSLSDLCDSKLQNLINKIDDKKLRCEIESHFVEKERFHKRKFVSFILEHIDHDFWKEKGRPKSGRIKQEELPDLLKRIYDQRSRTLHNGEPFPISIYLPPIPIGAEILKGRSMASRGKMWKPKDFIPYPHFFERLVNFVLKTFLLRN